MYILTAGKYYSEHSSWESAYDKAKKASDVNFTPCKISLYRTETVLWDSEDCDELKRYEQFSRDEWETFEVANHTPTTTPSIYFDIDGTLGYWYQNARGFVYPDEVLDPSQHYFRTIEPHPFMIDVAKQLVEKGYDVCVISAADRYTIKDKWEWLEEHCPFIPQENIFFSPLGADKNYFVKGNAHISLLIDDYKKNLKSWQGIPVKAVNTINSEDKGMLNILGKTGDELYNLYGKDDYRYKDLLNQTIASLERKIRTLEKDKQIENAER